MPKQLKIFFSFAAVLALSACGGDSSTDQATPATFGTGAGIDSGEIQAESTETLSGSLTITDPDEGESNFIAQSATQGKFGVFSLLSTGEWTYQFTNLATSLTSPSDIFTVTAVDGSEHQITILVKGLFQRLISEKIYSSNLRYEGGEGGALAISLLNDRETILNAQTISEDITVFEYNELGDIAHSRNYESEDNEDNFKLTFDYSYEYSEGKIQSYSIERILYMQGIPFTDDVPTLKSSKRNSTTTIIDRKKSDYSSLSYDYDETEENVELRYQHSSDYIYNEFGKNIEVYRQYIDTPYRDIDAEFENKKLNIQRFFHSDGRIDKQLYFRVSPNFSYQGIATEESFFYDNNNRLSYNLTYRPDFHMEGDIYIHDVIDYSYPIIDQYNYQYEDDSLPDVTIYNYLDEENIVVSYTTSIEHLYFVSNIQTQLESAYGLSDLTEIFGYKSIIDDSDLFYAVEEIYEYGTVDNITIHQYEDTDFCGDYQLFVNETSDEKIPRCKIKTKASSTIGLPLIN